MIQTPKQPPLPPTEVSINTNPKYQSTDFQSNLCDIACEVIFSFLFGIRENETLEF